TPRSPANVGRPVTPHVDRTQALVQEDDGRQGGRPCGRQALNLQRDAADLDLSHRADVKGSATAPRALLQALPRYAAPMNLFLDSFWRAVAYCMHPRVIALSFLPLAIMVGLSLGLGYFYWDSTVAWMQAMLESSALLKTIWGWFQGMGAGSVQKLVAPFIVILA